MASNKTGPIPGENYTSDTKNYPWHRPPDHTNMDSAIEEIYKKVTSEDASGGIITMMEMGLDISTITDMIVTAGIGAGKWTPDFAILLGGPTAHILYLMGKGYGLDPEMGYNSNTRPPTKAFFDQMEKIDTEKLKKVAMGIDISQIQDEASSQPEQTPTTPDLAAPADAGQPPAPQGGLPSSGFAGMTLGG
jgi:hypothetical protein